jgi:hypothetical protein
MSNRRNNIRFGPVGSRKLRSGPEAAIKAPRMNLRKPH